MTVFLCEGPRAQSLTGCHEEKTSGAWLEAMVLPLQRAICVFFTDLKQIGENITGFGLKVQGSARVYM